MGKALFTGAATALVTPFRGGAVDHGALETLIERQIAGGCGALQRSSPTGGAA